MLLLLLQVFPPTYPFAPPSILLLTPNGRFEVNTRLCLSFTDFHPVLLLLLPFCCCSSGCCVCCGLCCWMCNSPGFLYAAAQGFNCALSSAAADAAADFRNCGIHHGKLKRCLPASFLLCWVRDAAPGDGDAAAQVGAAATAADAVDAWRCLCSDSSCRWICCLCRFCCCCCCYR